MKLQKLISCFMLLGLLSACSNDTFMEEPELKLPNDGDSFMAVNIVTPKTATRTFEDGLAEESKVVNAKFFFFKADGTSAFTALEPTLTFNNLNPSGSNITAISNAIIVFDSNEGKRVPNSMVAILNPNSKIAALTTPTLDELKSQIASSYLNKTETSNDVGFIMSNSVYVGNNQTVITETPIMASNIFKTSDDANSAPLNVYVERLAAKVTTDVSKITNPVEVGKISLDGVMTTLKLSEVKWDIVTTNPQSNLLKKIESTYSFPSPFIWNDPTNFRSYWANSTRPNDYNNKSFDDIKLNNNDITYCLENTDPENTTKLLVSGILTDNNEVVLDLMEWGGMKFTSENMKTQMAGMIEYYTRTGDGKTVPFKYTRIDKSKIIFTKTAANQQYQVVANIAPGTYYSVSNINNEVSGVEVSKENIDEELVNLGNIKHWNGGRTYYYVDINHLHKEPGVVRNHYYKLTINSVSGLGTPVPVSDEIIIPIKPKDDDSYISAKINILAWNVISQDVDLK